MEVRKPPLKGSIQPSPIFFAVLAITIGSFVALSIEQIPIRVAAFAFGTGIWILSLIFHEFGHAIVAWRHGDLSVAPKGYLTLNPLKYAHPVTSIAIPVGILLLGGIGLPGGAVYIDRSKLTEFDGSKVSAAGPLSNLAMATVLLIPFITGLVPTTPTFVETTSLTIAPILAFSAAIQIIAAFLNALPIPPLDGFGIIEPLIPAQTRIAIRRFSGLGFILLFFLVFSSDFGAFIFEPVFWIFDLFNIDNRLIGEGLGCFRFWSEAEAVCDLGREFSDGTA